VLKRGYVATSELWNWFRQVVIGRVERRSGSIILLADDASEILRYNFYEGWPCRWKSFDMSALQSGTMVEELEIAVERIELAT
jgi:phage tail-like protein